MAFVSNFTVLVDDQMDAKLLAQHATHSHVRENAELCHKVALYLKTGLWKSFAENRSRHNVLTSA